MIDQYIQQLQSPDPAQRRSAIIALANAKDPAALKPLGAIYRTDPDPALREMALKAGRYIQQAVPAAQPTAEAAAPGPVPLRAEPVLPPEPDLDRAVSARDKELAQGLLDVSVSHLTAGDRARAAETLGKALALNPRLQKESFVANMVITLTNRPLREGVAVLSDPLARDSLIASLGGKRKLKAQAHGKGAETATWSNVAIDIALYGLVAALAFFAIYTLSLNMLEELFATMPDTTAADGTVYTAEDFTELFNDIGLAAMIPIALGQSVFSVISLLIQAAAIHGAATMILKGDGTLVYLLRRVVPFQTVVIMGYAGLFIVMSLLGGSESVLSLYGLVSFIGSLVVIFFLSSIVGQVYNFGAASGCGAILLGGILLVVLFFCGYCGLISVLGTLLSGAS